MVMVMLEIKLILHFKKFAFILLYKYYLIGCTVRLVDPRRS